jgi:hypothetical protein
MGKQLVNFITCGCEHAFVIYKAGREPTPYNMLLNLHMSLYNIILWPIKSSQFDNWFVNNRDFQGSNRRVWRYQRVNQNPYIEEEQTTQWPKEKVQKDKQRSRKHLYKTKDRVTRTPIKTGVNSGAPLVAPIMLI